MKTAGLCYNCFCRHKSSECKKTKQCSDCGGRHHRMLNCLGTNPPVRGTSRNAPSTEHLFSTSQMNPESTSFTPHTRTTSMTPAPTHGFLGHVVSQHDTRRFSPTTYVEICNADRAWHQIVAFFDSGSDTTLIRSSLAQRLGIAGKSELFRYGVAGGGSKLERSTRYTLQVRPVHVQNVRGYAIESVGIRKPAYNAPAIGEMVFNDFPYLRPAQGCLPLAGAEIDLIVGYDHAYLITAVHTISAPTRSEVCPSAAYTRLGWTLFGGLIPKPRAIRDDLNKCRDTYVNLAPVIDAKGFIRAEGRLGKLSLQPEVRHPITLPGNNPLVELYARRTHVRYLHQGYRVVLANIAKDGVHIGNGKELLKSVANKCLYCRTRRESTLQQQMGILPAFRGNPNTPPFAAVAVDFFGPLQTKVNRNTTTESTVMIVTCTTTRGKQMPILSNKAGVNSPTANGNPTCISRKPEYTTIRCCRC